MKRFALLALALSFAGLVSLAFANVAEAGVVETTLSVDALAGANEVPGPGDADGSGFGQVYIDSDDAIVCWGFTVSGVALPLTLAHIHHAAAGVAGPVVVNFNASVNGCTSGVDPDLIGDMAANPEDYYVNLHNADFPAGAIRDQLEMATVDPIELTADMDGDQEVPPVDTPATGEATVEIDPGGLVCFEFSTSSISSSIILAHIHDGAAGEAGPIVVDLQFPLWGTDGCVVALPDVAADILASPEDFYFNVHTEEFQTGEIRGQLEEVVQPTTTTTSTSVPGAVMPLTPQAPTAPTARPATASTASPTVTG